MVLVEWRTSSEPSPATKLSLRALAQKSWNTAWSGTLPLSRSPGFKNRYGAPIERTSMGGNAAQDVLGRQLGWVIKAGGAQ